MTQIDTQPLREYAAMLTAWLIERRVEQRKAPEMAFLDEMLDKLKEEFTQTLRDYVRDGTLICHKDLNGKVMFEFAPPKKTNLR